MSSKLKNDSNKDQYSDEKAIRAYGFFTARKQERPQELKNWILQNLEKRNCQKILDAACGTGIDSVMLLEKGFDVISTDGSDAMLRTAFAERWERRKEAAFDKWVIAQADWLTLQDDIEDLPGVTPEGFDAVLCLGNSFPHLPNPDRKGDNQIRALRNFLHALRPGGVVLLDHRNFDYIVKCGQFPEKVTHYQGNHMAGVTCLTTFKNGEPIETTLDFTLDVSDVTGNQSGGPDHFHDFQLHFFPLQLKYITDLIEREFGGKVVHEVLGDFRPLGEVENPVFYSHVIQKL